MLSHVVSFSNAISTVFSILVAGEFCNDWGVVLGGTTVFHSDVYSEYVHVRKSTPFDKLSNLTSRYPAI